MSRSLAKLLQIMNMVAMLILLLVIRVFRIHVIAIFVVGGIAMAVHIFLDYKLRCPHCGRWPRKGSWVHEFCPRCGNPLDD